MAIKTARMKKELPVEPAQSGIKPGLTKSTAPHGSRRGRASTPATPHKAETRKPTLSTVLAPAAAPMTGITPAIDEELATEETLETLAVTPPSPSWVAEGEPPEGFEATIEAEAAEEEEEEEESSDDSPTSELGRYFRDMAKLPVLRPQEEFERARRLEELEIATWETVLLHGPVCERVLIMAEEAIETTAPEFAKVRKLAASTGKVTAARKKEFAAAVRRASEQLRRLDLDKRALVLVLKDLEAQALYTHSAHNGHPSRTREIRDERLVAHLRAVKQVRRRAEREKGEFVKANLRLVISVARRFAHFGQLPFADLIQEGNLGLMTAVDRFDHRRGYRFSTYATWWIRHAIARAIADRGRTVRLPVHVLDSQQRVARWKRVLANRLGRQPTDEELSAASGIAKKKLQALTTVPAGRTLSLDAPVAGDEDDDRRLLDLVRDPEADEHAVADRLSDQAMLAEMRAQLLRLKPVEADILRQRFGLEGDEERTLKEIGEKYNLSRERIRQLQEQALGKMRKAFQGKGLT